MICLSFVFLFIQSSFLLAAQKSSFLEQVVQAANAELEVTKTLWPTLTSVEAKLLISDDDTHPGFYNEIAPITKLSAQFLEDKLSGLGQSEAQRDEKILEERAGSPVVSYPNLENLMLKSLIRASDWRVIGTKLEGLSEKSLAKLCKHQKQASCKNGKPVDYVRHRLYKEALITLAFKLATQLQLSELLELDRLVKSGRAKEARAKMQSKYALIFRDAPEIFTNTDHFQTYLTYSIKKKDGMKHL